MQVATINTKAPVNAGVDYTGIPAQMIGKPSKGKDTGKWDEIILPPESVNQATGDFHSSRAIRVTSQGVATPCTLTFSFNAATQEWEGIRISTNGNWIVKCQLDKVPEGVKVARAAAAEAQRAEWKLNGPKVHTVAMPGVPQVPGSAAVAAAVVRPNLAEQARAEREELEAELTKLQELRGLLAVAEAHAKLPAVKSPNVPKGKLPTK